MSGNGTSRSTTRLAEIATIIACILALLAFFGINSFSDTKSSSTISEPSSVALVAITALETTTGMLPPMITSTPALAMTNTGQPTATATPAPTTATPTPTLAPTSPPQPGDVLYQADWSTGINGWMGGRAWKAASNMLINDGTCCSSTYREFVIAPYNPGIDDYAVEAEIQLVRVSEDARCRPEFGIAARLDSEEAGYLAGLDLAIYNTPCQPNLILIKSPVTNSPDRLLANEEYPPDTSWHLYRLEVKGNTISLLMDGALVLETTDNRYLSGGKVGLYATKVSFNVRNFKIITL